MRPFTRAPVTLRDASPRSRFFSHLFSADLHFSHSSGPCDRLHHCFASDLAQLITDGSQFLYLPSPRGQTFKLASVECISLAQSLDVLLS